MKKKPDIEVWAGMLALEVIDLLQSDWFVKSAAKWKVKNLLNQCEGVQKALKGREGG